MSSNANNIKPDAEYELFKEPYEIDCEVDGKKLVAFVMGEYKVPIDWVFQVNFSDGFEALFTETDKGWWVEGKPWGKKYADAINNELKAVITKILKSRKAES